jgi:hypothetical protein
VGGIVTLAAQNFDMNNVISAALSATDHRQGNPDATLARCNIHER